MTRIAPRLLGFLLLSGLATSPALAQMYNAGDACPEPTPGRVFTQEGAAGPALVCNGTTLEVYESVLTGPLRKGIGTATPQATLDISSTDSVLLPRGTTAQRPGTPVNGMIRYNSINNKFEAYENGAWTNVIGGGTASAAGSTEEIQFNSGGNLAATSDFYWDTTNKYLTLDSGAANLDSTLAFANAGTRQWLLANRGSNSSPANSLLFYNHGTVNSGYVTMALTQNGDVGIGTTSPGALTHINTTDTTGNSILEALRLSHEDTDSAAANGNGAALTFNLETATNNTFREAAQIAGVWDDAANGSKDGSLRFYTMGPNAASGTTTTTERMRIDSRGFVGIGTATPGARLNVVDNSGGGTIWVQDTGASGFSEIGLRDSDGTAAAYISHDNAADKLEIYTAGARPIVFMPNGTERIRISQTGAMGIGTASPAATLHVNGEAIIGNTSLACSGTTEGAQRYNSTDHVMEFCNGTTWTPFAQVQTTSGPTAPAGSGYFVLTHTTWNGNLGGIAGADAKCLTELGTTYTSWRGYSTANSNGQITAGKVHAFLCDQYGTCNNLMPLTTYYFAYANSGTPGGASFTTDATGLGPNDSAMWSAANYFSGTYTYWMNRQDDPGGGVTPTKWVNSEADGLDCSLWTSSSSGSSGNYGNSGTNDALRWWGGSAGCNITRRLICFVNP